MQIILCTIVFLVYAILSVPFFLIALLISKFNDKAAGRFSQFIVRWAFRILFFFTFSSLDVRGKENIPKDGPIVFVSNHRSYFDIVCAYAVIKRQTAFVAKQEIKKVPILSWWMKLLHCFFLDRSNLKSGLQMINSCIEILNNGNCVFIAPEGTRNHADEMLPFKEGSVKMATKTNSPIVPVAFYNTDDVFENHQPWIRRTKVIMEFGKPLLISELDPEEAKLPGTYVRNVIAGMLENIKKEA